MEMGIDLVLGNFCFVLEGVIETAMFVIQCQGKVKRHT